MAGIMRLGAKFGVVGGTIYFTKTLGVWNDSTYTERIYKDIYLFTAPYLQDLPVEVPELPRITDITSNFKNYWNSGVLKTGRFLLELPELSGSFLRGSYETLMNQIKSPSGSS